MWVFRTYTTDNHALSTNWWWKGVRWTFLANCKPFYWFNCAAGCGSVRDFLLNCVRTQWPHSGWNSVVQHFGPPTQNGRFKETYIHSWCTMYLIFLRLSCPQKAARRAWRSSLSLSSSQQHHCYRNSAAAASFIIFIVYHLRYLRFTSHSKVRIQGSPARTQWANPNKTFFGAVSLEKHFILWKSSGGGDGQHSLPTSACARIHTHRLQTSNYHITAKSSMGAKLLK